MSQPPDSEETEPTRRFPAYPNPDQPDPYAETPWQDPAPDEPSPAPGDGQPGYGQPGYGQQPAYPYAQYPPAQYPHAQYPPAQYPPAQYPPAQYPPVQYQQPVYGYPYTAVSPPPGWRPLKNHPSASTALILGIIGLAGGMACYLPLFCAPFAWLKGHHALKAIDAEPDRWSGRGEALTGKITGIIGTIILGLGLLFIVFLIAMAIWVPEFYESDSSY